MKKKYFVIRSYTCFFSVLLRTASIPADINWFRSHTERIFTNPFITYLDVIVFAYVYLSIYQFHEKNIINRFFLYDYYGWWKGRGGIINNPYFSVGRGRSIIVDWKQQYKSPHLLLQNSAITKSIGWSSFFSYWYYI